MTLRSWPWTKCCDDIVQPRVAYISTKTVGTYASPAEWEVEYTEEFETWRSHLSEDEQEDVNAKVILLQRFGPALRRPHSGVIAGSKHVRN